jgi:hypothetical protein
LIGARNTLLVAAVVGSAATFGALFIPGMRAIEGAMAAPTGEGRVNPPASTVPRTP